MKTILYQPLFINPQAYFVFPQLYHIEKGDSYIEPANITGQLIINDLTQSLTSTPILNVVQDTNQVDFGLFKGKHNAFRTFSFNTSTIIYPNKKQSIVYQTKTSYNGKDISFGITKDTDFLLIGASLYNKNPNINAITEQMKITHGDILLFNRSLTEYEISWVKNNMMCSKQQEPNIDL